MPTLLPMHPIPHNFIMSSSTRALDACCSRPHLVISHCTDVKGSPLNTTCLKDPWRCMVTAAKDQRMDFVISSRIARMLGCAQASMCQLCMHGLMACASLPAVEAAPNSSFFIGATHGMELFV